MIRIKTTPASRPESDDRCVVNPSKKQVSSKPIEYAMPGKRSPYSLADTKTRNPAKSFERPRWLKDNLGRRYSNLANVLTALRTFPEFVNAFAYDEMRCEPVLQRALPAVPGGQAVSGLLPRLVRDEDVSQLQEWLQHRGLPKISREVTHQAVAQQACGRPFHPIRNYLERLVWDGRPRLNRWLIDYLGAAEGPYAEGIGRMFFVALVARIYVPGTKADYMLVLEGGQGAGKSRACRTLAGEWFSDSLPDIRAKDASQHLRGKWLIEIAELSAIGKADAEALKSFVSREEERYRPPYGRNEVSEPRQCVFVGTTNKTIYLKDETGARRFWPVRVGRIDILLLTRDRDQLFAEAVKAYKEGVQCWPDSAFEREHIAPEQRQRFEADPWETAIKEYVADRDRVTITEIAINGLKFDALSTIGWADQRRIIAVLTEIGFQPHRTAKDRFYQRAAGSHDA